MVQKKDTSSPQLKNRKKLFNKRAYIIITICIGALTISVIQILGNINAIPSVWATIVSVPVGVFSLAASLLQIFMIDGTNSSTSSLPAQSDDLNSTVPPQTQLLPATTSDQDMLQSLTGDAHKESKSIPLAIAKRHENIFEAPMSEHIYGREEQLNFLEQWIKDEGCRVVTVLGMGGIGKTSLAASAMYRVKDTFDYIYWIKLQNAPEPDIIIKNCIQFISQKEIATISSSNDTLINTLITYLQKEKCLLVFDNFETVLKSGFHAGDYRERYEEYGHLIQCIGEVKHQSCLLLTSREKPKEIALLEGKTSPVRTLELGGININAGQEMLQKQDLSGSTETFAELIQLYSGNPLALKIVSELIRELFGGNIAEFLKEKEVAVSDIHELLNQQFQRLSLHEQHCIFWLAIEREAVSFEQLSDDFFPFLRKKELMVTLNSLRRRSLIENSNGKLFTLQPVIMEFVTDTFIERICLEFEENNVNLFKNHALVKAQAKEYVRLTQIRLILTPLLEQLLLRIGQQALEQKLRNLLTLFRETQPQQSGYIAANILHLLIHLGDILHGYDFSRLTIWQAYLQGVSLPSVSFAHANFIKPVFTNTFGGVLSVGYSSIGDLIAAGTDNGEIRLWQGDTGMPLYTFQGHSNWVYSVSFDPTGKFLLSGGDDRTIRIWDVNAGQSLRVIVGHTDRIRSVAWSTDGTMVASGSDDRTIRMWNASNGQLIRILQGHTDRVRSVCFNIDNSILASGSDDHQVLLWDTATGQLLHTLSEHTASVRPTSFSPNGKLLASGSDDQQVILWDTSKWQVHQILPGHFKRVRSIAFSPDNKTVATSDDQIIRLWDITTGQIIRTFQGHINPIREVAFSPNGAVIVSGGEDQTVRIWDVASGQMLRMFQGHTNPIRAVALSPTGKIFATGSEDKIIRLWQIDSCSVYTTLHGSLDKTWSIAFNHDGTMLASGSEDRTIYIWDVNNERLAKVLKGHTGRVRSLAYSVDGNFLLSGSEDGTLRLWNIETEQTVKLFRGHTNRVWSASLSTDGTTAASGSEDPDVYIWDIQSGQLRTKLAGHTNWVRATSFSPDSLLLASGSRDHTIRIWEHSTQKCLAILQGHTNDVYCLAFSKDRQLLASGSRDHTIRIWNTQTYKCLHVLKGHSGWIYSVCFSLDGQSLISGSEDGTVKLWNLQTGTCIQTGRSARPYEGMVITGVKGLTNAQKAILKLLGAVEDVAV